jgi:hypothetical protein
MHGWLLAISSTGLAVSAHGVAGGGFPDAMLVLPLTALIAWGGAAMADRLRRTIVLVPALGLLQLLLHLLLAQNVHTHSAAEPFGSPDGAAMLAGHAVATVLTAVLLARASAPLALISSAIDRLRDRLRLPAPTPVPAAVGPGVLSPIPARPGSLLEIHLRRVHARRGPPPRS